jgi:uncharacterized protein YcbX
MAHVARLRRYPVKGFDAETVESVRLTDAGTVAGDREFALCDADVDDAELTDGPEQAYNGKQLPRIHELRTSFDVDRGVLAVAAPDGERREFDVAADPTAASEWLSDFFGVDVRLVRREPPAFVDRPGMGPSVVSTATLETAASWFEGLSVESVRRRMRANVEVDGVPAFWEDRFVGDDAPTFVAGGVQFEGVEPCARCVVPTRDPETGDSLDEFRERFIERREATFPSWADPDAFQHYYTLMLIAEVPESDRGGAVRVGDEVVVNETD